MKSLFSTFTNYEWSHIRNITQLFWVKVVSHTMKVMPLLFFLCNKQKDSISPLFSHHVPKYLDLYSTCIILYVAESFVK